MRLFHSRRPSPSFADVACEQPFDLLDRQLGVARPDYYLPLSLQAPCQNGVMLTRARLTVMEPNLAQVLNTLAHEIRTPLAVSQGYLKLYLDGRLAAPADQRRALQKAREALGVIALLCVDMGKVSALSEVEAPMLAERLEVAQLSRHLRAAGELAGATWDEELTSDAQVATNAPADLVRAISVMIKAAFDEATDAPHRIEAGVDHDALVIRAGTADAVRALASTPDGPGATGVNVGRGGKGLSLVWATFVLGRHRIQAWNHRDHQASLGLRLPLVTI